MFNLEWRGWLLLGAALAVLYFASSILLPFVLGAVLAYLLSPLVKRLEKFMPRWVAVLSVILVVIGGFSVAFILAVPVIIEQAYTFAHMVPDLFTNLIREHIVPMARELGLRVRTAEVVALSQQYAADIGNVVLGGVQGLAKYTMSAVSTIFLLLMTPVVLYYVLKDGVQLESDLKRLIPAKHRKRAMEIFRRIDASLSRLLRGQVMVCVWLGSFYGISLYIFGLQMGLLIGIMTGLMSFIPFVGMAIGVVTAYTVAMMQFGFDSWVPYAWMAALFIVGQIIEGAFLQPRFASKALGIHPLWVVFTVLAGGAIGGFLGVLIALPLAAVVRVLLHEFFGSDDD